MLRSSGALRKCWSMRVRAGQEFAEAAVADGRSPPAGRSPTRPSSGRRPSPRSGTCWPGRCRTRSPPRYWSTPRRNGGPGRLPSPACRNQARADCAFIMVSCVVKVLEATMNSVVSGLTRASSASRSWPSTFETKCMRRRGWAMPAQRLADHFRAEVGAADADVDDVGDRLAGVAEPVAGAHAFGECPMPVQHRMHLGVDVLAVDHQLLASRGARSAVCRTARCSVLLIRSPANMASRCASTPRSRASAHSRSIVSRVDGSFSNSRGTCRPLRPKMLEALRIGVEQVAHAASRGHARDGFAGPSRRRWNAGR